MLRDESFKKEGTKKLLATSSSLPLGMLGPFLE
jgi:hypothetical protein